MQLKIYKKLMKHASQKILNPPNPNPLHLMGDHCLILGFLGNFPYGKFPGFKERNKQNPSENCK